jgi:hypothetical protein
MAILGVKTDIFGQIVGQNSLFLIKMGIFFICEKIHFFRLFSPQTI